MGWCRPCPPSGGPCETAREAGRNLCVRGREQASRRRRRFRAESQTMPTRTFWHSSAKSGLPSSREAGLWRLPCRSTTRIGITKPMQSHPTISILMGYDEHWLASQPGPVASQSWFTARLAMRMRELDPARTIVAIANYGYDWTVGSKDEAEELTLQEAVLAGQGCKSGHETRSLVPQSALLLRRGRQHARVWFMDAITAYNQLRAADKYRPRLCLVEAWRGGPVHLASVRRTYGAPPPATLGTVQRRPPM